MHIMICLDPQNGRLFNNRRQSSDRCIRDDLMARIGNGFLWMDTYSASQFSVLPNIRVCDAYSEKMTEQDHCFVERGDVAQLLAKARCLTIYRWDKVYPADSRLDADVLARFSLMEKTDIAGYSHDRITREVYIREK